MDIQQRVSYVLQGKGYEKYREYTSERAVYLRRDQRGLCAVEIFSLSGEESDGRIPQETLKNQEIHGAMDITEELAQRFQCTRGDVHILHLVICDHVTGSLRESEDPLCWIIDKSVNRLLVYENRIQDFYGLRYVIEQELSEEGSQWYGFEQQKGTVLTDGRKTYSEVIEVIEKIRKIPVTAILLVINVVIFLLCAFWTDAAAVFYGIGMLQASAVLGHGEYWRVITSIFLHADTAHLFSNMIMLLFVGESIERIMGSLPYLLLYLTSGVLGNVLSLTFDVIRGENGMSLGASGAVFGVMGAMLLLVFAQRRRLHKEVVLRVALGIGCCLYNGFVTTGINNAAHVGGMAGGIICFGLWLLFKKSCSKAAQKWR